MENVVRLIKKHKGIVIGVLVLLVAIITLTIINSNKKTAEQLSSVEELKLKEISEKVVPYLEEIENAESNEIDRYINYSLEKVYNEENKTSLTISEMKTIINDIFTIDIKEEQLEEIGITPTMLDKNITYDFSTQTYTMNVIKLSLQDIAAKEIIKYEIDTMEKSGTNYIVTYKKYLVKNPYEILNYYNDLNNRQNETKIDEETGEVIESKEEKEIYDTKEIMDYLKGNAKLTTIKKHINKDNIGEVGEEVGTIKVTYVVREDKILIDNISK